MANGRFPSIGDTLSGKYRLTRQLGRGGMGVVCEATLVGSARRVAVKILLPWAAALPEFVYRFEHEARAAALLRGGHTVRVFDVDTSPEGLPFLVMEYLEGRCLRKELDRRGRLPVEDAVRYMLEACEGVREAHACGIVHRDIKPSNLFLSKEGKGRVVKVLDFGVAKGLGDNDALYQTEENACLGTYKYMSPEQARSAREADARADIWSLGVVLYELLAGQTPFRGKGDLGTLFAVATQAPPPLCERRPDAPAPLADAIERALRKDVRERYQTVGDFADALAPFGPARTKAPSSGSIGLPSGAPASAATAPGGGARAEILTATAPQNAPTVKGRSRQRGAFGRARALVWLALIAASIAAVASLWGDLRPARPGTPPAPPKPPGPGAERL